MEKKKKIFVLGVCGGTWRRHDDELLGFGDGVIMNFDGDAATSARNPSKSVEMAAEIW